MELISFIDQLEVHFNKREPEVLAFIPEEGRFGRLRRDAKALVARYPDRESRPPLFGTLIGIKDIFHADGFPTRGGSKLPPEVLQGVEAESVTILKNAGALVLGKTVTTEFAYFGPGPTRNPHNPDHTPGGSSSGSAAAVGATLCALAFGTQTIGSVIRPASFCGVVGYKPTYERISRAGVIPLSASLDHVGVFTPDVAGAKVAASLLCHDWRADAESAQRKPVFGIPEGPYLEHVDDEGREHFNTTCRHLSALGYEIKTLQVMPDYDEIFDRHYSLMAAEAAQVHKEWFAKYGELYHPKTVELIERGQSVSAQALSRALEGRARLRNELTSLMDEHSIDLWLSPSATGAAPQGLDSTGNPVMNLPWTHSGLPVLNLPSGVNAAALPFGLQVVGRWNTDEALFAWAESIESKVRRET